MEAKARRSLPRTALHCPPTTVTPLRTDNRSAVYRAAAAVLLCSPSDLTLQRAQSPGFRHPIRFHRDENGSEFVDVLPQCDRAFPCPLSPCHPSPCGQSESSTVHRFRVRSPKCPRVESTVS